MKKDTKTYDNTQSRYIMQKRFYRIPNCCLGIYKDTVEYVSNSSQIIFAIGVLLSIILYFSISSVCLYLFGPIGQNHNIIDTVLSFLLYPFFIFVFGIFFMMVISLIFIFLGFCIWFIIETPLSWYKSILWKCLCEYPPNDFDCNCDTDEGIVNGFRVICYFFVETIIVGTVFIVYFHIEYKNDPPPIYVDIFFHYFISLIWVIFGNVILMVFGLICILLGWIVYTLCSCCLQILNISWKRSEIEFVVHSV